MSGPRAVLLALAALATAPGAAPLAAQAPQPPVAGPESAPTYADLAALADGTPLVVHARVREQIALPPERAPGVGPGITRLYMAAETISLLSGNAPIGGALNYLVDVPLTAKGKPPKLKKQEVLLFARPVAGHPAQLQLVRPDAQLAWSPALEGQLKPILAELASADAPPAVTGVRDALSTRGNLTGESDTQIFLTTATADPAALSIVRRPGIAPRWGVSWTELVDQSAAPPAPQTIGWYRLACGLPEQLPSGTNLAENAADRARAAADYRFVIDQLGPCRRNRD